MKFGYKQHKTFKKVMKPQNEEEKKVAELFAAFFAEFVVPHYMSNRYEPYGFIDGEMWFRDIDTEELTDYDDLWCMCKVATMINGEDDEEDDRRTLKGRKAVVNFRGDKQNIEWM